jgi:hypothetical protein
MNLCIHINFGILLVAFHSQTCQHMERTKSQEGLLIAEPNEGIATDTAQLDGNLRCRLYHRDHKGQSANVHIPVCTHQGRPRNGPQ